MRSHPSVWAGLSFLCCLSGCGRAQPAAEPQPGPSKVFVLLLPQPLPFCEALQAGAEAAKDELAASGVARTVTVEIGDGSLAKQVSQLADRNDLAGVAVSPVDAQDAALAGHLKRLGERGIPVVTVGSDLDRQRFRDCRAAYVGPDNFAVGQALGQAAAKLVPSGGGYLLLAGNPAAQRSIDRSAGFAAGAGQNWRCLRTVPDRFDPSPLRQAVRDATREFQSRLVALVSLEAAPLVPLANAVAELGPPKIRILACDVDVKSADVVHANFLDAWILLDPYETGRQGVQLLHALEAQDEPQIRKLLPRYGQADGDLLDVPFRLVPGS